MEIRGLLKIIVLAALLIKMGATKKPRNKVRHNKRGRKVVKVQQKSGEKKHNRFLPIVYVDSKNGNSNNSCSSPQFPCKDLSHGVQKVDFFGTVYITGTIILATIIKLDKSVTVKGERETKGIIKGNGLVKFAFDIVEVIHLKLSDICFDTIGMLMMRNSKESATFEIENVVVRNTRRHPTCFSEPCSLWISTHGYSSNALPPRRFLTIKDSVFRNTSALRLLSLTNVTIQNCTFYNDDSSLSDTDTPMRCLEIMRVVSIIIEGSTFIGCKHKKNGGAISITNQLWGGGFVSTFSAKEVGINRCWFIQCASEAEGGALFLQAVTNVMVTQSNFTRCSAESGGAISIVDSREGLGTIYGCEFEQNDAHFGGAIYLRNNRMSRIQNAVFHDNMARTFGQAVYSTSSIVLNNIVTTSSTDISTNQLHLQGDSVSIANVYINTRNRGDIRSNMIKNGMTISSKEITLKERLVYVCPVHFRSKTQRSSYLLPGLGGSKFIQTLFMVYCESCNADTYTLITGAMSVHLQKQQDPFNVSEVNGMCLECPTGGVCRGNIKPLDNYWGYLVSKSEVTFVQCPPSFCCSSQTTPCTSFNTCNIGRKGTLCGSCDIGYSQSFVSNGCVNKSGITCDTFAFIGYFVAVSFVYTILLTFLPSMINGIKSLVATRKMMQEEDGTQADENPLTEREEIKTESVKHTAQNPLKSSKKTLDEDGNSDRKDDIMIKPRISEQPSILEDGPPPISAYITLIAFFFQVASLVHVEMQQRQVNSEANDNSSGSESEFQKVLFDLFNFRMTVSRKLCPTDELTLPVKEFINVALKLSSIANLILFYLAGKMISFLLSCYGSTRHQDKMCTTKLNPQTGLADVTTEDFEGEPLAYGIQKYENLSPESKLSFDSLLKIGMIKLVKLNFTSMTTYCFHMINCVEVGEHLKLYLYGDLQCYVWWQKIILGAVLPMVLAFPFSFGMVLNLLKDGFISTNQFLLGSVMPLYTFYLLAKKCINGLTKHCPTKDEEMCIESILEMEEELFQADNHLWRWTVIQLHRNVLIVLLNVFILNPIYRSIFFICVFGIFAIHDRFRQPYEHPYLNHLQLLCSTSLLVLSACNIPASFSLTFDVMSVPYMKVSAAVLRFTEMAIYIVVPLSLVLWMVLKKFQTRREKAEHIIRDSRRGSGVSHISGHLSIF